MVKIRDIRKEDLMAVAEITIDGWRTAYKGIIDDDFLNNLSVEENYQRKLKNYTENDFIVAELNNEIVGFCRYIANNYCLDRYPNVDCELCAIYVKTENKRNGIGKELVNYVIRELKKQGRSQMILWCLKDNYPARAFYEEMGGTYCGEQDLQKGNKTYKEVGYIYNLNKFPKDELELVFPTKKYKKDVEEYLQEFIDNGENEISGDGGLDQIKDFDTWLKKIEEDLTRDKKEEGRIPATLYLTIRKKDQKIVGNVQIRHILNEKLLNFGGHIGDSVRPSERKKGYATEQIRLALEKCKELGIKNVLMDCDKNNIGSAKSIQNNGGILENEIYVGEELVQRYWISLKKRFPTDIINKDIVENANLKIRNIDNNDFKGDIALIKFNKMSKPFIIEEKNICMANDNYFWLEFYDYSKRYKLTAMYNDKKEIVEWYFDIARKIGKENGIPYEDDLYLDVIVTPEGKVFLIDENDLEKAYEKYEVTKGDYDMAYETANNLIKNLKGNMEKLKKFTNEYLEKMLKE